MRIGFFTDSYLPINFGLEISIETFKKNLEIFGHQVFVFTPKYSEVKKSSRRIIRFSSLKVMNNPESRLLFFDASDLEKICDLKLEIAHAHTPWTAGWLAKMTAQKTNIPLFYTNHTLYPEYVRHWLTMGIKILPPFLKWSSKFYCNLCDQIIAPSQKVKDFLKKWKIRKPISVLPTGVNLKMIKNLKKNPAWRQKFELAPTDKVLLYVGRLSREKNIPFLIKCLALVQQKIENAKLVLVGEGAMLWELKKIVKSLGLKNKVVFTGLKSHEETLKIYKNADLFVFSSLVETQSLVLAEAAATGLPIIALQDKICQNLVKNGQNGYQIYPAQPKIFAERIIEVLTDPIKHQKFSRVSEILSEEFSAPRQAQKLSKLYQGAIKKYGSRG